MCDQQQVNIGLDNGLAPVQCQAIILNNYGQSVNKIIMISLYVLNLMLLQRFVAIFRFVESTFIIVNPPNFPILYPIFYGQKWAAVSDKFGENNRDWSLGEQFMFHLVETSVTVAEGLTCQLDICHEMW